MRQLGRRLCKMKLTVDREIYIKQCKSVHHAICEAKTKYPSEMIVGFEGDQKELFKSLPDTLLKGKLEKNIHPVTLWKNWLTTLRTILKSR